MSTLRSILPPPPPQPDSLPKMTERQFIDWCDSHTWAEWVDGEVIVISPVGLDHGRIVTFLIATMKFYADEHDLGDVLSEPFQTRFAPLRRRRSPDIIFVSAAREKLFAKAHFEGGPDLIVEVVSRESQSRDRRDKYMEYQLAGVREYWVIDPLLKQIEIHALGRNKRYSPLIEKDGIIRSTVLTGFFIRPEWLWQLKAPKISAVLGEIAAGG